MKDNKKLMFAIIAVVIIIVAGVVLAGGSKNSTTATSTTAKTSTSSTKDNSSAVATTSVKISNFMFDPMVIKVKVGDNVTWTNMDSVHHTVTADVASADAPNGPLIGQGETYSFKFTKAGTYTFHCTPHSYMHGTVVVTE